MGSSFRHDDHIPFLEMKGVSTFDRWTSKFTGNDLSHPDLAANHERGRTIDDIEKIGVIGVKLYPRLASPDGRSSLYIRWRSVF